MKRKLKHEHSALEAIAAMRKYVDEKEKEIEEYLEMRALIKTEDGSDLSPFGIAMVKAMAKEAPVDKICRILDITEEQVMRVFA